MPGAIRVAPGDDRDDVIMLLPLATDRAGAPLQDRVPGVLHWTAALRMSETARRDRKSGLRCSATH